MKAFVLYERGKSEVREVPKPICGDNDILLKMTSVAICGSDLHAYLGIMDPYSGYPIIMGHENSGIIAEKGKNVTDYWQVGDRVVSENTAYACGRCPSCAIGNHVQCEQRKTMGFSADGVFAEYVLIPGELLANYPNCLFKLPDSIPFDDAPQLEPASNGYKAVIQEANFQSGESIVVFGAGALGLYAAHAAAIGGATNVILCGLQSDAELRFGIGKKMGCTHFIVTQGLSDDEIKKQVADIVGPDGVDVVVDAAGAPSVFKLCIELVRNQGRVVRIGMSGGNAPYNSGVNDFNKICTIIGHMGYDTMSWKRCIALADAGILDLHSIVTHKLPLEKIPEGMELVKTQQAGKVVIQIAEGL